MGRHSPAYYSPPRRGYGGRGRSPPMRGYGGHGGHGGREHSSGSLLVRNIPLNCRAEDLRIPFERFGPVRDVYLPKDYYSGEPRGFGFVQFVDPYDASEAQYHMNKQIFGGREITVVVASESRKRPEEMRRRTRTRGPSDYGGRQSTYYGRSHSRSRSRSPLPRYPSSRHRSRSYSPAPKRHDDYSVSPRGRQHTHSRSQRDHSVERRADARRSYSPGYSDAEQNHVEIGYADGNHESRARPTRQVSASPPGSRSRSADISPRHNS